MAGTGIAPLEPASFALFGRNPWGDWRGTQHHLAARLAARFPTAYVELPARRLPARLRPAVRRLPGGPAVVTPADLPLQRFRLPREANVAANARAVAAAAGGAPRPFVAVLYAPEPPEVAAALRPDLLVYHAVDAVTRRDDGSEDPRLRAWEDGVLATADLVIAVSEPLAAEFRDRGARRVLLLPNGWDEGLFDGAPRPEPEDLAGLPRPLAGFAGTVRADRLDAGLLLEAARARPGIGWVFVGPTLEDGRGTLAALRRLPNVRVLGPRPRDRVPAYVAAFSAVVCPYADQPLNRACSPLKALESLAAGRPVVFSPERPDLASLAPGLRCAGDARSFLAALDAALAEGTGPAAAERRRASVADATWARRADAFLDAVRARLAAPAAPPAARALAGTAP